MTRKTRVVIIMMMTTTTNSIKKNVNSILIAPYKPQSERAGHIVRFINKHFNICIASAVRILKLEEFILTFSVYVLSPSFGRKSIWKQRLLSSIKLTNLPSFASVKQVISRDSASSLNKTES